MKTLITFLVFIFLLTTAQAQEITATLSGNTASDGFSVKNMAGTTRFRVNAVGGVGIGTTSPQNLLDIEGSMVIGADYSGTNTAPANGLLVQGNVGIGTTSPSSKLEVSGSIETGGLLDQNATNFFDGGCGDNQHVTGISSSGTITCGSNSGDIAGVIAGFGLNGGGTTGTLSLSLDLVSANSWSSTQTFNANTNFPGSGIWNTAGNVGIGDLTPDVELDVVGDINYTGTITDVSDARLKENIVAVENALEKIQAIDGVYFNMIDTPEQRDIGLIAQNVKEVLPEAVSIVDTEKGYLGVSYPSLIPVLIEAIKEQQKQIEELERRISSFTYK